MSKPQSEQDKQVAELLDTSLNKLGRAINSLDIRGATIAEMQSTAAIAKSLAQVAKSLARVAERSIADGRASMARSIGYAEGLDAAIRELLDYENIDLGGAIQAVHDLRGRASMPITKSASADTDPENFGRGYSAGYVTCMRDSVEGVEALMSDTVVVGAGADKEAMARSAVTRAALQSVIELLHEMGEKRLLVKP